MNQSMLADICKTLRHDIITSSTAAGSGHPTSSLSAVELLATLFFGGYFKYDLKNPDNKLNDRVIFSKGHASPLFYALYKVAGAITEEELLTFRKIDSDLEGHPTPRFRYTEASTGSLGQGLSVGLGIAMGMKLHFDAKTTSILPKTYVLLGDSEVAEGQIWEAAEVASHYKMGNLIAILDVNRLGQRGETMLGWDVETYGKRFAAFGWNTIVLTDGHNLTEVDRAFAAMNGGEDSYGLDATKPTIIIAKTKKGRGVSFLENKDNWHGMAVPTDMMEQALREIAAPVGITGSIATPEGQVTQTNPAIGTPSALPSYSEPTATRQSYGDALVALGAQHKNLVVLDAETSNSTYANKFQKMYPERFFEMFIAEQNMVSVGVGLARMGFVPYVSSFAAFLARGFDQIRMAQYSDANLKVVGSHAGVSIGYDGSSQMALEDLGMMKGILNGVVLYPSDPVSTLALVTELYNKHGVGYLRLTREKTASLYKPNESFPIGGSKILKESDNDTAVIFAAGITIHEALKAHEQLKQKNVSVAVVDLYSVKPVDVQTVTRLAQKTGRVIVVEDHYPHGGLADSVREALAQMKPGSTVPSFTHLCVREIPHSGAPSELLRSEEIDAQAIGEAVEK